MFSRTDKILILGISGSGKTYLSRTIQECYPRVWIFDTLEEYDEKIVVKNFSEFSEVALKIKKEKINKYRVSIRLDPNVEDKVEVYDEMIKFLYYLGDCLIVTEEIQEFTTPHKMGKWLKHAILTGRHVNVSLMFTTQRIGLANKTLISQCKHVFCGQTFENNDLIYLEKAFGPEIIKLKTISPRFFLYFELGKTAPTLVKNTLKGT